MKPGPLNLGARGGLLIAAELDDGTREIHGHIETLDAETAPKVAAWLVAAQSWLDGTGVSRATESQWERMERGVVVGPRKEA